MWWEVEEVMLEGDVDNVGDTDQTGGNVALGGNDMMI